MKEKILRIKDKICAIWHILRCKEFALFTCKQFDSSKGSTCTISLGIEDKEKSKVFRETISKYIIGFEKTKL